MIKTTAKKVSARRALIHRGDSTHHQLQVMLPVSFRPINNTVKRLGKPIPLEEEEELLDIIFSNEVQQRGFQQLQGVCWHQTGAYYSTSTLHYERCSDILLHHQAADTHKGQHQGEEGNLHRDKSNN